MHPDTGPVVVIGLQQIYEAVVELKGTVSAVAIQHTEQGKDISDHELRIRALERGRWPLPALSILIAAASLALTAVVYLTR